MPLTFTATDVESYLGGTHDASNPPNYTFYGVAVTTAQLTAAALTPTTTFYQAMWSDGKITANQGIANQAGICRAARLVLEQVRRSILAGQKIQSYSLGKMSVSRVDLLKALQATIDQCKFEEQGFAQFLMSAGDATTQADLVIVNPNPSDSTGEVTIIAPDSGVTFNASGTPGLGGYAP